MADYSNTTRAALWMIGAIVSFTSMAIAGRAVAHVHDTFEIMLFRSILGFCCVICIAYPLYGYGFMRTTRPGLHGVRNLLHFTGQNLWFFALPLIPLAQLFALEFTSPLWVMLLAPIFLSETLTMRKILVAIMGAVGVYIVVDPQFNVLDIGVIAGGVAAIAFALTALATRSLSQTDSIATILFYLTGFQVIFGIIGVAFTGDIIWPNLQTLPWLALIGVAGLTAHFSMTKALQLAPATTVMPIDFARLPLVSVIGVLFYSEVLTWGMVIGIKQHTNNAYQRQAG